MYKFLIKKTCTPRNLFEPYTEIAEGEESIIEFQTDDLTELDTEILVNIIDE